MLAKEFGTTFIYILGLFGLSSSSLVFVLPVDLYFVIGFAQFVVKSQPRFLRFSYVQDFSKKIISISNGLKLGRAYVELFVFLYSVIIFFKIGIMFPALMFSYLRIRGAMDQYSHYCF